VLFMLETLKQITKETTDIRTAINRIEDDVAELRGQLTKIESDLSKAMVHAEEKLDAENGGKGG